MNTNFVGRPQECLDYINQQSAKATTNQEIVDNFLGVYSKKYLGNKGVIKEILSNYQDSRNFQEITNKAMDPKLLIVSNSELYQINHRSDNRVKNLSSINCGFKANFGFIIAGNSSFSSITHHYFWYLSLDDSVCNKVNPLLLKELTDIAFLANHDFIHAISLGNEWWSNSLFGDVQNTTWMPGYEYMSLSFHYAIFQDIYTKYPHIKTEIIQKAKNYLSEVEKDTTLERDEKEYLIGTYIYFLWRILPCWDRPKKLSNKLSYLVIDDSYPSWGNISKNSKHINTTYQQLKEWKTIINP